MTSELVKYAPKAVIEELDKLAGIDMVYELFEEDGLLDANVNFDASEVDNWVYAEVTIEEKLQRELAVINHVFGNERLQPERESRYYVNSIDVDGEDVTYYLTDLRILDFCQSRENVKYECGMSKQLAEAIVAEIGGTIEEIK